MVWLINLDIGIVWYMVLNYSIKMFESEIRNCFCDYVENNLLSNMSFWLIDLIEMIGIRKVLIILVELVWIEWLLCSLFDVELLRIDEFVRICSLLCVDFSIVEEILYDYVRFYR